MTLFQRHGHKMISVKPRCYRNGMPTTEVWAQKAGVSGRPVAHAADAKACLKDEPSRQRITKVTFKCADKTE